MFGAKRLAEAGAGEKLLSFVDNESNMKGYDISLLHSVSNPLYVPHIDNGGAGQIQEFANALNAGGASAVTTGIYFIFRSSTRGILINYPSEKQLKDELYSFIIS